MTLHVALNHRTHYHYDRPVHLGPQVIRLRPAPHCRTPILSYSLQDRAERAFPQLAAGSARQLPGAPRLSRPGARSSRVEVDLVAEMAVHQPVRLLPRAGRRDSFRSRTSRRLRAASSQPYLRDRAGAAASKHSSCARCDRSRRRRTVDFLVELNQRLQRDIALRRSAWNPACRRCEETLELGRGSCRDTAWLLVQILRHWAWPRGSSPAT